MRIVALGTSQFLVSCVRGLNKSGCFVQEIISLPKQLLQDNSIDPKDFATEIGAEYFETVSELLSGLKEYFEFYNFERPHQSLVCVSY